MTLLFSCRKIKKEYGHVSVLRDISFDINEHERVGIVGVNGCGKTTLVNILMNNTIKDSGQITWYRKNLDIKYLKQSNSNIENILDKTVYDNCPDNSKYFYKITSELGLNGVKAWEKDKVNNVSEGEKAKISLAGIMKTKSDLLILDEPTNHLDFGGIEWLINELKKYRGTVIIISHDRYFLDKTVNRILEIEEGIINEFKGNYSFYKTEKERRYKIQMHQFVEQEKYKNKISSEIKKLSSWSDKAHKDSRKKAVDSGNKFGGKEYNRAKVKKMDKQIKSKTKRLEKLKIEGIEKPKEAKKVNFKISSTSKINKRIIEASEISKSYRNEILFKKSSFYIMRGEKIGLYGANGCGKTTLVKIILGKEFLDEGKIFSSKSAKIGYLKQKDLNFENAITVKDIFNISSSDLNYKLLSLLNSMGFRKEIINFPINNLSMGEKTKIKIASLIINESNVLILDEPTNHLDLQSREKLEETLSDYNGTVLLISHDRYMLEKICDKMLIFKDKKITRFEHNFDEYMKKVKSRNFDENEKILLDNRIAFLLSELNKYTKDDKKIIEIDSKLKDLLVKKKSIET